MQKYWKVKMRKEQVLWDQEDFLAHVDDWHSRLTRCVLLVVYANLCPVLERPTQGNLHTHCNKVSIGKTN